MAAAPQHMDINPLWQEFLRFLQANPALIVSIAAVIVSVLQFLVAKSQWKTAKKQAETARNKLRLELFERRMRVYDGLIEMANIALSERDITFEVQRSYKIATHGAEFLFNKEIDNYCRQLSLEAIGLTRKRQHIRPLKLTGAEQYPKAEESYSERLLWFSTQIDEMPKRFAEFLKIEG